MTMTDDDNDNLNNDDENAESAENVQTYNTATATRTRERNQQQDARWYSSVPSPTHLIPIQSNQPKEVPNIKYQTTSRKNTAAKVTNYSRRKHQTQEPNPIASRNKEPEQKNKNDDHHRTHAKLTKPMPNNKKTNNTKTENPNTIPSLHSFC
ncbi:hypothetical protein EX30DRAFT_33508 [Ascodesmis nigricans]|uniref:Uncharacterized protein n=1 Tax=Ascodesmis nigricans TaxID=341454 RepID=A0A4S2MWG7_9PEZI|nr:hypothetical protein EX30DRAFT_33508 [Ascodesmis nigricans]